MLNPYSLVFGKLFWQDLLDISHIDRFHGKPPRVLFLAFKRQTIEVRYYGTFGTLHVF